MGKTGPTGYLWGNNNRSGPVMWKTRVNCQSQAHAAIGETVPPGPVAGIQHSIGVRYWQYPLLSHTLVQLTYVYGLVLAAQWWVRKSTRKDPTVSRRHNEQQLSPGAGLAGSVRYSCFCVCCNDGTRVCNSVRRLSTFNSIGVEGAASAVTVSWPGSVNPCAGHCCHSHPSFAILSCD